MEFNSMLLKLQIKRALKLIPKLLIGSLMIIIIVGFVVFFSAHQSNEKTVITKSKVALVTEDNEFVNSVALEVLQSMESISVLFDFIQVDKKTAMDMLHNGELTAVAIFPDTFIEGIHRGDNIPAEIYMTGDANTFGTSMVAELADAVCQILSANEAGTYAMNDWIRENDYGEIVRDYDSELDMYNFKMLFDRVDNFEQINLVGENDSTLAQGYVAAGMVLLILLVGMSCGSIFSSEPMAFSNKLREVKIGQFRQLLYKLLALITLLVLMYSVISVVALIFFNQGYSALKEILIFNRASLFFLIIGFIPCIILAACFTMFTFTFADNQIGGILFLFSITIVCGYISGLLYPTSYLPKTIIGLQKLVPTTYMHKQATLSMNGEMSLSNIGVIFAWSLALYLISVFIRKYRSKKA